MPKSFEYPVDIDPSYYAAIGEVTARWAWLEHRMSILVREGFKVDKTTGRAWTSGMEALTLHKLILDVLVKGAWIRNSTTRQSVEDFSNAVNALRKRRNGVAHGVYGPETTKPGTLYRIEMRGFNNIISPDGSPITVKTLQELAAELRVVQEKGLALTSALKKAQRK